MRHHVKVILIVQVHLLVAYKKVNYTFIYIKMLRLTPRRLWAEMIKEGTEIM